MFVIARSNNRPTLQHAVAIGSMTSCGRSTVGWRKAYQKEPIFEVLCLRCRHHLQTSGAMKRDSTARLTLVR